MIQMFCSVCSTDTLELVPAEVGSVWTRHFHTGVNVHVLLQVSILSHDPEGAVGPPGVDPGHSAGWEDLHLCLQRQCGSWTLLWYLQGFCASSGPGTLMELTSPIVYCHLLFLLGLPNNTGLEVTKIMAKVPCKEDVIFRNSSFRKAVSRYVRCYSQVSLSVHEERRSALYKVPPRRSLQAFLLNTDRWIQLVQPDPLWFFGSNNRLSHGIMCR